MLRYNLAATGLKAFSLNRPSRKLYRWMGNTYGAKRRERVDIAVYRGRGNLLVNLYE